MPLDFGAVPAMPAMPVKTIVAPAPDAAALPEPPADVAAPQPSVKEMKAALAARGVDYSGATEKSELRALLAASNDAIEAAAEAAAAGEAATPAAAAAPAGADPPLDGNELYDRWLANRATLPADFGRVLDPALDEERRGDLFDAEDEEAQEKYAWAIPDERALRICAEFAPLVEMGAGAGYWARLLRERGVEIAAYDRDVGAEARAAGVGVAPWTEVRQGSAEVLGQAGHAGAALLLMYPDDLEEGEDAIPLSLASLEAFEGETLIHVGELFGESLSVSMEGQELSDVDYPWGRSTDARFQIRLVSSFHKVLQVPLPCWANARDSLTVWRRTKTAVITGDRYAYVPGSERVSLEMAAPDTAHLL